MKSINPFLDRVPSSNYNCLDYTKEVWSYLFGEQAAEGLERLCEAAHEGGIHPSGFRTFERLQQPISPCFAVFQRRRQSPHVGIFLDGRILHLREGGAEFVLAQLIQRCLNMKAK